MLVRVTIVKSLEFFEPKFPATNSDKSYWSTVGHSKSQHSPAHTPDTV